MKSIIQNNKECYITRLFYDQENIDNLHEHHIFFGIKNRKLSEKYGLKVYLTYEWHEGKNGVHGKNGRELDKELKKLAQKKFEEVYPNLKFIKIFGKNYI